MKIKSITAVKRPHGAWQVRVRLADSTELYSGGEYTLAQAVSYIRNLPIQSGHEFESYWLADFSATAAVR